MKFFLKTLLVLLLLIVLSIIILLLSFNPNDYKEEINQRLSLKIGRDVKVSGSIQWSLYPWLGFNIGYTEIAQDTAFQSLDNNTFSPSHFAHCRQAQLHVKLLPLLQQRLEFGDIYLIGVMLNLQRRDDGFNNWQDLLTVKKPQNPSARYELNSKTNTTTAAVYQWQLSRVFIKQAEVFWEDRQAGLQQVRLQDVNLQTGIIGLTQAITVKVSAKLDTVDYFRADVDLNTQIRVDLAHSRWELKNTDLTMRLHDQVLLAQPSLLTWKLPLIQYQTPDLLVNASLLQFNQIPIKISKLQGQFNTLEGQLQPIKLDIAGVKIEFDWRWQAGQAWQSHWLLEHFNPRPILSQLNLLKTLPKNRLQSLGARFDVEGDDKGIGVYDLSLNIDEHQINAQKLYWQTTDKYLDIEADILLANLTFALKAQVQDLNQIQGELHSDKFNPQEIYRLLGLHAPLTQNPKVLQSGRWHSRFDWVNGNLQLSEIDSAIDQTVIKGLLNINLNKTQVQAQLQLDKLNINDYLPPKIPAQSQRQAFDFYRVKQAEPESLLPTILSIWQGQGQIQFTTLQHKQLQLQQFSLGFSSDTKHLQLKPQAALYQGSLQANIDIYPNLQNPRFQLSGYLQQVDIEALLSAWTGQPSHLRGQGKLQFELGASLKNMSSLEQSLTGLMTVNLSDGALQGMDLLYQIDNFRALLKHANVPTRADTKETIFDSLQGHFQLENQRLHTDDLQVQAQRFNFNAQGDLDLKQGGLDYQINTQFWEDKLIGARMISIPVSLGGTLDAPKPHINIKDLISVQDPEWKDKLKQKAKQKLRQWFH